MNDKSGSLFKRLVDRVFPRMPDFFSLIDEQCDLALESMQIFVAYLQSADPELAQLVRTMEHRADEVKYRNIEILNESFSTPMDREDLYDAISGIDQIINFAKTTVYELHMFEIAPDECMQDMAEELKSGVEALRAGFALLKKSPQGAEQYAKIAHKSERNAKKVYRRGLVALLDKEQYKELHAQQAGARTDDIALDYVEHVMKYREIYRHLSHGADRLGRISELLQDIIVKLV
jgi:hypothetical protein